MTPREPTPDPLIAALNEIFLKDDIDWCARPVTEFAARLRDAGVRMGDEIDVEHRKALGWHHRQMMTTARNCSYCWSHRATPEAPHAED